MNYNTNQSIFIQIAERICDRVLSGNYKADTGTGGRDGSESEHGHAFLRTSASE